MITIKVSGSCTNSLNTEQITVLLQKSQRIAFLEENVNNICYNSAQLIVDDL